MSQEKDRIYWAISFALSLLFICAIGYKWLQVERIPEKTASIINNNAELDTILEKREGIQLFRTNGEEPFFIPTGFFIQSLAFVSSSDVNLTGYIWQKYPLDFPKDIEKGVIFPEEVDGGNTKIEPIYQKKITVDNQGYELQGWYFDVTVRQPFDYTKYPLDNLTVWLRLWPKDLNNDSRILPVPDFDSYDLPQPANGGIKFGIDKDFVSGEWETTKTFYSFHDITYDTNFGFLDKPHNHTYKELYINVALKRKFINAFVINLVPLFVVAILLFAQVMTVTERKGLVEKFGFNTTGAIATCSALFFVVMLAHIQVRSLFPGSGLTYIEHFYLTMYFAILATALNSYIFSLGRLKRLNIIFFRDNFIPKVTYWPILLGIMTITTWLRL